MSKTYLKKVPEITRGYCTGCFLAPKGYSFCYNKGLTKICLPLNVIFNRVLPPPIKSIKDLPYPKHKKK